MKPQDICQRTFQFSVKLLKFLKDLPRDSLVLVLINQVSRSGTSIGANTEEAQNCGTRKEFVHVLTIALKEARETEYWLKLIKECYTTQNTEALESLLKELNEIIKILTAIIKKTKQNTSFKN